MKSLRIMILLPCLLFADVADKANYEDNDYLHASASSRLEEPGKPAGKYDAWQAIDGSVATAWCPSTANTKDGIGESIELDFPPSKLKQIHVVNGYAATRALYFANNRVKKAQLEITAASGRSFTTTVNFTEKCLGKKANETCVTALADYQVARFKETCANKIKLTILEVYPGKKYRDTCIAEIALPNNAVNCK